MQCSRRSFLRGQGTYCWNIVCHGSITEVVREVQPSTRVGWLCDGLRTLTPLCLQVLGPNIDTLGASAQCMVHTERAEQYLQRAKLGGAASTKPFDYVRLFSSFDSSSAYSCPASLCCRTTLLVKHSNSSPCLQKARLTILFYVQYLPAIRPGFVPRGVCAIEWVTATSRGVSAGGGVSTSTGRTDPCRGRTIDTHAGPKVWPHPGRCVWAGLE